MNTDVTKFDDKIYQIDVHMEGKPQRMSCYYIDTSDPILIEVGPSNSFPYLISALAVSYTHLTLPTTSKV